MLKVLAEDRGFVAIDKPAGRIVVPGRGGAAGELALREELERQLGRALFVVHRLDSGTSGVLLFATDAAAHRALSTAFEHHRAVKRYWALVRGSLFGAGAIDDPLVPVRAGQMRVATPGEVGAKASRTAWRALERVGPFTAVEFRPETGRLHQIRAHALAAGHPLVVDPAYGGGVRLSFPGTAVVLERTPLHAASLKFPHPLDAGTVRVESPLPDDLAAAMGELRKGGPFTLSQSV